MCAWGLWTMAEVGRHWLRNLKNMVCSLNPKLLSGTRSCFLAVGKLGPHTTPCHYSTWIPTKIAIGLRKYSRSSRSPKQPGKKHAHQVFESNEFKLFSDIYGLLVPIPAFNFTFQNCFKRKSIVYGEKLFLIGFDRKSPWCSWRSCIESGFSGYIRWTQPGK